METTKHCEASPTLDKLPENETEKFKEILKRNNIQDSVSKVIIKESGLKGENMASLTSCVTIKFENPQLDPIHLFVKREPDNEAHSAMVTDSKLFKKEAMFFMEYLPEAQKLCKKMGHENLMDIYPKCYYGDDKLVVLENLILTKGFMLHKKEDMQDFDAAKFALTSLAKHHAISYACIRDMGGPEEFFKRFADFTFLGWATESVRAVVLPFVEDPIGISINILLKSNHEGKNTAIEVLKGYQGKAYEKFLGPFKRKFEGDDVPIRVLNHGDYWNSNMMFLKDKLDGEKFQGHIMIDLQMVNYCTPAVDVGFYLFSSVRPAVRQARLNELLEVYLDALVKTSVDLGYPIEMTSEDLLKDFRETFVHGFLMGLSFCTGVAYAVMGDADPTDIDIKDFAKIYNKLVEKWIAENPDKKEEIARILVSVVEEHQKLVLG